MPKCVFLHLAPLCLIIALAAPARLAAPPAAADLRIGTWHGYAVERFTLPAADGERIPMLFISPGAKARSACVFAIHGVTDRKDAWVEINGYQKGGDLSLALLGKGFAVCGLDLRDHGDRRRAGETSDQLSGRIFGLYYQEFFQKSYSDIKIALAYLRTRPDVDPERMGILGYSLGTIFTFYTADRDPGLKAAVTCVVPARDRYNEFSPVKNLSRLKLPWLMLMGRKDDLYDESDARYLFELLPMGQKKLIFYDSGHSLPVDYVKDAAAWFGKYLR